MKKILIIHTFGLGDMIMFTPTLQIIHELYPNAKIDFLLFQKLSGEVIKYCEKINNIYYSSFKFKDILKSILFLRSIKYDLSISTSGTSVYKASILSYLIASKQRVGELKKIKIPFYTKTIQYVENIHRVENNLNLMNASIQNAKPFFCINKNVKNILDLNTDKLNICIHAGSNLKFKNKRWAKEYFIVLIKLLLNKYNCNIYIISGKDELEVSRYISEKTRTKLIEDKFLHEIAYFMSNCDVMINTDSGLGHIASCFDMKIFTIFGPAKEYKVKPFSKNAYSIKLSLDCQPCYGKRAVFCKNIECLNNLEPLKVFEEISIVLDKNDK